MFSENHQGVFENHLDVFIIYLSADKYNRW